MKKVKSVVINTIAASLIFILGYQLGVYVSEPTPMQKMLGIHDHMKDKEIRYVWRQVYCGRE